MYLRRLNIGSSGLDLFLGPLEAQVLEAIYAGATDIPAVHKALRQSNNDIAYTTTATTVNRLAQKGIITREHTKPANAIYRPTLERAAFIEAAVEATLATLVKSYGSEVAAVLRRIGRKG